MKKKLYKSKKHWVVASVAVLAIVGSHGLTASAEESAVVTTETSQTTQVDTSSSSSTDTDTATESSEDVLAEETTPSADTTATAETSTVTDEETSTDSETSTVVLDLEDAEATTSVTASSTATTAEASSTATVSEEATVSLDNAATGDVTDPTAETPLVEAEVSGKTLTIQYHGQVASDERVKFAVWSDQNDQDDLIWYDANAMGAAYVDLSKHKNYGLYHIHTYSFLANGQSVGRSAISISVLTPEVTTQINKVTDDQFTITVSQVPDTITQIKIPVWSSKDNQDDIKWYDATKTTEGTYTTTVSTSNHHNDYGHYNAHIYGKSTVTGGLVGLSVTSGFDHVDSRPNATVSVVNYAENKTSFDVVVSSQSNTKPVSHVAIAVWSEDKGQDDIKWYEPTITNNQARATVRIAELSNTSDTYNVHVYTDYSDGTRVGQVLGAYKITKPAAKNTVTANLTTEGLAISLDSNTVTDYSQVKFAVWSETKGQDDIKWYDASASGTALAAYSNHSGYGTYHIHTYDFTGGRATGLTTTAITIAKPSATATISTIDDTTYQVKVSDVPAYISSVVVPVWSDNKGQDDITWVTASRQDATTYVATVSLKAHNYESGHYSVHVYGKSQLGNQTEGLAVTSGFTVGDVSASIESPVIQVSDYDKAKGTVTITVSETDKSKAIKEVSLAAWSQDNQQNIHWYKATPTNGTVSIKVDGNYHHNLAGDYTIHAYITTTDGISTGYVVGTYPFDTAPSRSHVSYTYKGTGVYDVVINDVCSSGDVIYAVWSEDRGQDDLKWYTTTLSGTTATSQFRVTDHTGTGAYHIHVYQKDNDKTYGIATETISVRQNQYNTPYYSQRDSRWASRVYGYGTLGNTGCVPTSLAMVFSSLKGQEVLPTQVADYLYNNTVEFNRGGLGTSSVGILMATNQWGYKATALASKEAIISELQEGHHVLAAVQNNKFVRNGTHEIVLKGYSNGMTYVSDPYYSPNSGWYSIDRLWAEQSTDSGDLRQVGRPFIKITDN